MSSKQPLYTSTLFWMPSEVQKVAADAPTGVLSQSLNTAEILNAGATGAAAGAATVTLTAGFGAATTGAATLIVILGAGAGFVSGFGVALGVGGAFGAGAAFGAAFGAGAGLGAGGALGIRNIETNKLRPSLCELCSALELCELCSAMAL